MKSLITNPLVSILLPARNAEKTLGTCLKSLVAQRESRWECVLVNDGSTDRTGAIAHEFAASDSRIRVLESEHRGIVASLNAGLRLCRGESIARMDADDRMHPDRLAAQDAALKANPAWAVVGCHVELFPGKNVGKGQREYETWLNGIREPEQLQREAFIECPIAHPTFFGRKEAFTEFRYEDSGWPEDYDLVLRWLGAGQTIGIVPRKLLFWRQDPHSLSRTGDAYRLERFTQCKAFYLREQFLAKCRRYVLWGYGGTGRALCRALAQNGALPSHIVELHPGRLGQTIAGAPVIGPNQLPALMTQTHEPLRIIVSVSGAGPRAQIRGALSEMGFCEGRDYLCAA